MSRAIIVLAPPRTGSSALAGVLQRLGVQMGDDVQPADMLNKKGYYEDRYWQTVNKDVAGWGYEVLEPDEIDEATKDRYRQVIAHYDEQHDVWGFKNPRACFTLQFIWPLLDEAGVDVRVVDLHRDYDDAVRSLQRHSRLAYGGQHEMTLEEAAALQRRWHKAARQRRDEALARQYLLLGMWYEVLMRDTFESLETLWRFCFDDEVQRERLALAAGFLSPELRNFGG